MKRAILIVFMLILYLSTSLYGCVSTTYEPVSSATAQSQTSENTMYVPSYTLSQTPENTPDTTKDSGAQKSISKVQSDKPPKLTVKAGSTELSAVLCGYSWSIDNGDGTSMGIDASSPIPPECVKYQVANPPVIEHDSPVTLYFEIEPYECIYHIWEDNEPVFEQSISNFTIIPDRDGLIIYEVIARWEAGRAAYAFAVRIEPEYRYNNEPIPAENIEKITVSEYIFDETYDYYSRLESNTATITDPTDINVFAEIYNSKEMEIGAVYDLRYNRDILQITMKDGNVLRFSLNYNEKNINFYDDGGFRFFINDQQTSLLFSRLLTKAMLENNAPVPDEVMPAAMPDDFDFIVTYGLGGMNVMDTFKGVYTRDLIEAGSADVPLQLSQQEMIQIYSEMKKINIMKYPYTYSPLRTVDSGLYDRSHVDPYYTYSLKLRINGRYKEIYWKNENYSVIGHSNNLKEMISSIFSIVNAKEIVKSMPTPRGGYD
ncbi:MAG: hypothetical protein PHU23_15250 [Dehalococcoidales bacterium]|nr:hypothetical protein [Dehalococcoidales bacterium]